jgi:anti-sigma regulatory factor (Ser/Thr protein kinase)
MQTDMHMAFRSDPRLMCSIRGLIRAHITDLGFAEQKVAEVVLAVDEACTNAIRHSYEGCSDKKLELEIRSNGSWVEIFIEDTGLPAPPEKLGMRELTPPGLDELKPHGLGVQLIHSVFDEVVFEPGEKRGNRTTLRLRLPKTGKD